MNEFEKHLEIKDQLQAQVEQELQKVKDFAKRDPTLLIFVIKDSRIKVVLILLFLVFLI
jgi:ribosome-associated translation inhibitor RaiA